MPATRFINANECTLTVHAYQSTDKLLIEYQVESTSSLPVYLFNRLARIGCASVFDIDINSTNMTIKGNEVMVSKMILPVPEDVEIERVYIPCITRLEPGNIFKEEIILNIPLSPFTWYTGRPLTINPLQCSVHFALGYATTTPITDKCIKKIVTEYGDEYSANWFPLESQEIIAVDIIADNITAYSAQKATKYYGQSDR